VFGRDLHAVAPGIKVKRPGTEGTRERYYTGIGLKGAS
jgi:hypothetical protein